jgi:hypothetical protein
LIDFGWAKTITDPTVQVTYGSGTTVYNPPEILTKERWRVYNESHPSFETRSKIDVYAFGLLVYELFAEECAIISPDPEDEDFVIQAILNGEQPVVGESGKFVEDLCLKCWAFDPTARPPMRKVANGIVKLGKDHPKFMDFVKGWEAMVERSDQDQFESEFRHGTLAKLEMCAQRGLPAAVGRLR